MRVSVSGYALVRQLDLALVNTGRLGRSNPRRCGPTSEWPTPGTDDQIAFYRVLTDSKGGALGERRLRISRIGGWPKKRLYSRLNWLALSYPTSKAALAASRPSMSMRPRAACSRSCFWY